ncbi:MAG: GyrI-like domain-containing protein [Eubacteriaceae bacterium]|nr:GyrI-like domain-containing protein [Eubacteriaceae bacterium]
MAKLESIEFQKFPNTRIIGCELTHTIEQEAYNPIPALWEKMMADGTLQKLRGIAGAVEGYDIGWIGEFDGEHFTYIAGIAAQASAEVPQGMQFRDIAACDVAIGYIFGNLQNGDVYAAAYDLTVEGIKSNGYKIDSETAWSAEIYPTHMDFSAEEGRIAYLCAYSEN